jgi:hypothetical protein
MRLALRTLQMILAAAVRIPQMILSASAKQFWRSTTINPFMCKVPTMGVATLRPYSPKRPSKIFFY